MFGSNPRIVPKMFNMSLNDLYEKYNNSEINSEDINKILERNLVSLNVYYDELSYTIIEELVKTELSDIISNVGGTLGLYKQFFLHFFFSYLNSIKKKLFKINFKFL